MSTAIKEKVIDKKTHLMTFADLDFVIDNDMEFTQKRFEILRVGEFFDQRYGKFSITEERLHKLKKNFDENVLKIDVAIDLNHDPTSGAFAWVNDLIVEDGKLFMLLKDVTEEGRKIFREKKFKYFSVEFAPFTTVIDGKKTTFNDVLRGVALTNRPVIKDMQPTFLSEDVSNSIIGKNTMSFIMKLAENLMSRDSISKADAAFLRGQFDETAEEERPEGGEEKVAEVEAKAETDEAAAAKADEAKGKDPAKAEGEPKGEPEADGKEKEEPAAVEAAEMSTRLSEVEATNKMLLAEKAERTNDDRVAGLTLSETTTIGFAAANEGSVRDFIKTLSEGQFAQFKSLVPKVVDSAQFGEIGSAGAGAALTEDAKLAEAAKLSEKFRGEGLSAEEAMRKAQKEVGLGKK